MRENVKLPPDLTEKVDEILEDSGFGSREEFVEVGVRRLLDHYRILTAPLKTKF